MTGSYKRTGSINATSPRKTYSHKNYFRTHMHSNKMASSSNDNNTLYSGGQLTARPDNGRYGRPQGRQSPREPARAPHPQTSENQSASNLSLQQQRGLPKNRLLRAPTSSADLQGSSSGDPNQGNRPSRGPPEAPPQHLVEEVDRRNQINEPMLLDSQEEASKRLMQTMSP